PALTGRPCNPAGGKSPTSWWTSAAARRWVGPVSLPRSRPCTCCWLRKKPASPVAMCLAAPAGGLRGESSPMPQTLALPCRGEQATEQARTEQGESAGFRYRAHDAAGAVFMATEMQGHPGQLDIDRSFENGELDLALQVQPGSHQDRFDAMTIRRLLGTWKGEIRV